MSEQSKIVFLGGVHGAGKTFLAHKVAESLGVRHYSASQIIRMKRVPGGRTQIAEDESALNQKYLISGLREIRLLHPRLILDGHYSLVTSEGKSIRIEPQVFADMQLSALAILCDSAVSINAKLMKRDGESRSILEIKKQQNFEMRCAKDLSNRIGLRLVKLSAEDSYPKLEAALKNLLFNG